MKELIAAIVVIFSEFTWRKFFALVTVFALMFLAFSLFERYTSSFRLSRLQKSAELLSKLQEMQSGFTNASPELKTNYQALMVQSLEAVQIKPISLDIIPSKLHFSMDYLWKFLAGSAAWIALTFLYLIAGKGNSDTGKVDVAKGMLTVACVSGVCGMWVPPTTVQLRNE